MNPDTLIPVNACIVPMHISFSIYHLTRNYSTVTVTIALTTTTTTTTTTTCTVSPKHVYRCYCYCHGDLRFGGQDQRPWGIRN